MGTPMNADENDELTEKVIGALFQVSNSLGAGFLEKVYERALLLEMRALGIRVVSQASFPVRYRGQLVGEYYADLVVEGVLLVELKCVDRLASEHVGQCVNYLRASGLSTCLLVNFARPRLEWKRVSHTLDLAIAGVSSSSSPKPGIWDVGSGEM